MLLGLLGNHRSSHLWLPFSLDHFCNSLTTGHRKIGILFLENQLPQFNVIQNFALFEDSIRKLTGNHP